MTPAARFALYGAIAGTGLGLVFSAFDAPPASNLYVPQTTAGVIAGHFGFAVPWALAGAFIGYIAKRRVGTNDLSYSATTPTEAVAQTTAVQRLGHVLGWTGNVIAVPIVALGVYGFTNPGGSPFVKGLTILAGVAAFLIGRALRYIFAGSFR